MDLTLKKQPLQQRSVFMVDTIKQAATHILKERGVAGFTTNLVAERAGVSIGSLYQYFGSKETIIAEIKRDHFNDLRHLFQQAAESLKTDQLVELTDAFIDASVEGHLLDPELHRLLSSEDADVGVKEKETGEDTILAKVENALSAYQSQLRPGLDIETAANLTYYLVEKTVHDAVLNSRCFNDSQKVIKELKTMVAMYLMGPEWGCATIVPG